MFKFVEEHCDEMHNGALSLKEPWSTVMTRVMENCYDMGHGAL